MGIYCMLQGAGPAGRNTKVILPAAVCDQPLGLSGRRTIHAASGVPAGAPGGQGIIACPSETALPSPWGIGVHPK